MSETGMQIASPILRKVTFWLLATGFISVDCETLPAQGAPGTKPSAEAQFTVDKVSMDRAEIEAFVDQFFAEHLERLHAPGATFALVQDGKLVLAKGFGFSSLADRRPVVAEETLFDVQSIAKLFTVTALMQAVERGVVRLDDDVNTHLKEFQLEQTFPEPVRLSHLMTHTSGLEDRGIGITARRESDVLPLGQFLARSLPSRVRPPGQSILYSDCGICLAGYALESASGVPLGELMEENILKPLEMRRTRFFKLPPELARGLAVGYSYENGEFEAIPHDYYHIWPASSLMTTATDMARFMIAHLQNGRYGEVRILSEENAQQMHRRQFSHHPRLPGVCFDFFEHFENGQRTIGHTGAGSGFVSELLLVPDHRTGYFLAANSADGELLNVFRGRFFDRYFRHRANPIAVPARPHPPGHAGRFAGWYWSNRYDRRTVEKAGSLVGGYVRISANEDGSLSFDGRHYVEIEPLLFQRLDGDGHPYLAFREDEAGFITDLLMEFEAYEKVAWHHTPPFQLGLMVVVILVFISCCVGYPVAYVRHRLQGQRSQAPKLARLAQVWAAILSAMNLATILAMILMLRRASLPSVASEFQLGAPPELVATLACSTLFAALSLALPPLAVMAWAKRYWSVLGRLHFSLVALASLGCIWFLNAWNLVGLRY